MTVTMDADWSLEAGTILRVEARVRNDGDNPVALWTALRRVGLDGSLLHGDRRWVFATVEGDTLHLRRCARAADRPPRPGVHPPDFYLLAAGETHREWIELPVPVPENDPLTRAGAQLTGDAARVSRLLLSLGYVPFEPSLARSIHPLGPAYPGIGRTRSLESLLPLQQLLTAELAPPSPVDVLRYTRSDGS